jgi:hypothetical protein
MDIKEFVEKGFLQEANRNFFHLLGLALEVSIDEETEEYSISGVWDYREDKGGNIYAHGLNEEKADYVKKLREEKEKERLELYGSIIEPLSGFRLPDNSK